MRVLFLGIDGCVYPAGPPLLIEMLEPHPDVFIVVHSSWRETYPAAEIGDMLGALGQRYLGVTPPGPKWESITTWLSKNTATSWRILDDTPREFPDPPPLELIVCHPLAGLSAPEVHGQLNEWLNTSGASNTVPPKTVTAAILALPLKFKARVVPNVPRPRRR